MQELFLAKKVSLLERCPRFRGAFREGSTLYIYIIITTCLAGNTASGTAACLCATSCGRCRGRFFLCLRIVHAGNEDGGRSGLRLEDGALEVGTRCFAVRNQDQLLEVVPRGVVRHGGVEGVEYRLSSVHQPSR